ncbi:flagellar hook-length control protein FliK [Methylobacter sp.]|uniref:flagellar hook-length control protein FliK n=1 Tax=Methylobacter sp. TaxID=2051955 RepID=UPI00121C7899|nr:flagellar hook-length control protein FliK [Methylobacter sp.]TAK62424.1 MAG: flagellar hook-length control protein FliK [Methylobacter sp.]
MDINSLINTQTLLTPNRLIENSLNLKVGQQLDAKIINADIQAAKNAITLSLGDKNITVQSSQPIKLNIGQELKIQVTQVAPVIEFTVLDPLLKLKSQDVELRLKLISTARDGGSIAAGREPARSTARDGESIANGKEPMRPTVDEYASSPVKLLLNVKITGIINDKIQLLVLTDTPPTAQSGNKQTVPITIDRTQLTNASSDLKVGQNLNLEILKTGATPEFKIIPTANIIPEAKIAEFIKQFLPRHEASPIFLNQLIKDLPELLKNRSVPQALKDIAVKIVQNLPPKEQLITSQGLKLAIANSGLFFEAKLPAMAQAELIKELPQLIKNESVPQSLQRIAAEILQNLTQKEPLLNGSGTNSKPIYESLVFSPSTDTAMNAEGNIPKAGAFGDVELITGDFKANLLKFIQALKQEITHQSEQHSLPIDLDLLKNLQHKTENTVAKLVLDQLMSLPKEDNLKQLWIIDIPFVDRQQAESIRIEVQRDKENKRQSDNGDWSVNITITPPGLGTIHCIVSYRNDVINTFFKSQNIQTTELIKHNLDYLKKQLEESGLKTGHIDARVEAQKTQPVHPHQLTGKKLFDDKA